MALKFLSLNVVFLKMMTHYPLSNPCNIGVKCLFYFWRCLSIICLSTFSLQCIADIFVREKIEFVEVSMNIMNAGTSRLIRKFAIHNVLFFRNIHFQPDPADLLLHIR